MKEKKTITEKERNKIKSELAEKNRKKDEKILIKK